MELKKVVSLVFPAPVPIPVSVEAVFHGRSEDTVVQVVREKSREHTNNQQIFLDIVFSIEPIPQRGLALLVI
jgi:hypothetical protein